MWKKLFEIVGDLLDLRREVKGHDKRLDELSEFVREISTESMRLSERLLRVELELEHLREQQAAEREMFRLRLENLLLRYQRGLPPGGKEEPEQGPKD
jgi:hypothetical protein